ncbi:MAG: hypothetical protein R2795_13995 [Saprospiraceae bacterium]
MLLEVNGTAIACHYFLRPLIPEVPETGTYRKDLYLGQLLEIFTFDSETEEPLPGAHVKLIDPVTGNIIAEKSIRKVMTSTFQSPWNAPIG